MSLRTGAGTPASSAAPVLASAGASIRKADDDHTLRSSGGGRFRLWGSTRTSATVATRRGSRAPLAADVSSGSLDGRARAADSLGRNHEAAVQPDSQPFTAGCAASASGPPESDRKLLIPGRQGAR